MIAQHCAALRPRALETPDHSIRRTLRSFARRWLALDEKIEDLVAIIEQLVLKLAPRLLDDFRIGVDAASEILFVTGDKPEWITFGAASASPPRSFPFRPGRG